MEKKQVNLGHVAQRAVELLRQHPNGLSMSEMREILGETSESQEHFNRRIREIRKIYALTLRKTGNKSVYVLGDEKPKKPPDSGQVSEKIRAAVLHAAHGKCQMCGQTIASDGIKLQADHKIPQSWGGPTQLENLWAICESCNRGKRNFFGSFDTDEMKAVMGIESVHERIAFLLRRNLGEPVPSYLIEFVANCRDQQLDWRKRLRELRYPVIGLKIDVSKKRDKKGVQSFYTLMNWVDIPKDHVRLIKDYEVRLKER